MSHNCSAADVVGRPVGDLDTPALVLDREATRRNLERMACFFADRPAILRPHFKNHKCTRLAQWQLDTGSAVGITCAKLSEAEILAANGFEDLLIANQVVGKYKLLRLARLAGQTKLTVAADDPGQIAELSRVMVEADALLGVLVEIDIGMGRCGVPSGEQAIRLAHRIAGSPGLRFAGIQAYEGHVVYEINREARADLVRKALALAHDSREQIERSGLKVPVISGGSSSTYDISGAVDGFDEIQAGTYATMDWRYHQLVPEFEIALSVLARVISRRADHIVVDAGVKSAGGEFGSPRVEDHPEAEVPFFLAEEHLVIRNAPSLDVGDTVRLIPSHACTTCNLHREMHLVSSGEVVDVWPIEASGRSQ